MMVTMSKFILKIDEALITILKKGKVLGTFCVLSFFSFFLFFLSKAQKEPGLVVNGSEMDKTAICNDE